MTRTFPLFDAANSVEVVNARMAPDIDPRLAEVMTVLVRHLHAAVKEARITGEEWMTGIRFLTETGQMCSDWRQEFILLSDALGVSMLVDAINHHRPEGSTENTVLGPFHVPDAPRYPNARGHQPRRQGRAGAGAGPRARRRWAADRGRDARRVAGDTRTASTTSSRKASSPTGTCAACSRATPDGRYWFRSAKPRYYPDSR